MIDQILNNNPVQYSRCRVENMLRNPEDMILDQDGYIWMIFIHDSKRVMKREIWLVRAAPVAMAVYLGMYSVVHKLLDIGYNYEPAKRFQAYNVEGDIDKMVSGEGMVLLNNTTYRTIKYNDVTNIQLITCIIDSPMWILDGIWKEAEYIVGREMFEDIFYNMKWYYTYSDRLIKESDSKAIYTNVTTKGIGGQDTVIDISQICNKCFDRMIDQVILRN